MLDNAKSDHYIILVHENKHDKGLLSRVMHGVKDYLIPKAHTNNGLQTISTNSSLIR